MKNKKTDSEISMERIIKDVESWGILTLMMKMKDMYLAKLDKDRASLVGYQTQPYHDSPLKNLDMYRGAFERTFDREFKKIYNQMEKEHEQKN
jgi:hypothetical protein